jgi:hypothetical protein
MDTTEAHDAIPSDSIDLDVLSDAELELLAKELDHKLHQLTAENLVFETFFNRMLPGSGGLLNDGNQNDGAANSLEPGSTGKKDDDPESKINNNRNNQNKKKKGEKNKESDRPALLSMEEKNEIALREMEELRDDVQKRKEDWAKILDNYKVFMSLTYHSIL